MLVECPFPPCLFLPLGTPAMPRIACRDLLCCYLIAFTVSGAFAQDKPAEPAKPATAAISTIFGGV